MNRRYDRTLLFISVTSVAVALFLLLPFLSILKILLISLILLCLVWGISEVDNRLHLHQVKQQWRRINLQRFKNRLPPHRSSR
jgi:Ca2+/Na+ antiporter